MILYRTKYFGMLSGIGKVFDKSTGKVTQAADFNKKAFMDKYRARMQKKLGINNLTDQELEEMLAAKRQLAESKLKQRAHAKEEHNRLVSQKVAQSKKEVEMGNRLANGGATQEDIEALKNKNSLQSKGRNRKTSGEAYEYGGKYYKYGKDGKMVEITDGDTITALKRGNVYEYGPVHTYTKNGMNIHYNTVRSRKDDFVKGIDSINTQGTKVSDYGTYHDTHSNLIGSRTGNDVEKSVLDDIKFDRAEDLKRRTGTNRQTETTPPPTSTTQTNTSTSTNTEQAPQSSNLGRNLAIGAAGLGVGALAYGGYKLANNKDE